MLDKIKALPSKVYFGIGITLILVSCPLLNVIFPLNIWSTLCKSILFAIGVQILLIANKKKYSKSSN